MMVGHVVPIQLVSKTQSEIHPYLSAWAMHAQDSDPPTIPGYDSLVQSNWRTGSTIGAVIHLPTLISSPIFGRKHPHCLLNGKTGIRYFWDLRVLRYFCSLDIRSWLR